jgi:hypothetical protein
MGKKKRRVHHKGTKIAQRATKKTEGSINHRDTEAQRKARESSLKKQSSLVFSVPLCLCG